MKQLTVMRESLNAIYAQMKEALKLKPIYHITWYIIMNVNTPVQNVVKSFIHQHI